MMMKKILLKILLIPVLSLLVIGLAQAAEMDHAQMDHSKTMHMMAPKPKKGKLDMVKEQPASGKAREAGSDGRYHMEPTSVKNSLATRCAQASRGLILLDNKTWTRCGGKTRGVAVGPRPVQGGGHSGH
jgi:hypothetical protein